jgi:hypothetical protein
MGGPAGYSCPNCDFDTDITNCDDCDAVVMWDDDDKETAHCSGCGQLIAVITYRECGYRFDL